MINNANNEFGITDSYAVLDLPDGLSLAGTSRGEELVQKIGNIGGGETKSATWIVKGDKAGSYDLSAEFTGILTPMNKDVKIIFRTESPLIVHDGEGLELNITVSEGLDYWTNEFTFTNNSGRPIYNFAASISGNSQLVDIEEMLIEYPDGTVERLKWNNGKPDEKSRIVTVPVLYSGESHRTIEHGETVTGYIRISREDGYTNDYFKN